MLEVFFYEDFYSISILFFLIFKVVFLEVKFHLLIVRLQ